MTKDESLEFPEALEFEELRNKNNEQKENLKQKEIEIDQFQSAFSQLQQKER
jgi:hypothetical protein